MRKLAIFAGAFSATVLLWRYSLWPLAIAAALLCCLGGFITARRGKANLRLCALIILSGTLFALLWSFGFYHLTLAPWGEYHKENDVSLTARIDGFSYLAGSGNRVVDARFTDPATGRSVDGYLYLSPDEMVLPGEELEVLGRFYLADWVGEEELTYFSARGTFVRFYTSEIIDRVRPDKIAPRYWPLYAARYTEETITRFFAEDTAPLARALITGNKEGLDEHFQVMSRRAGLAHIIVISGMHVSVLAGFVTFALGKRGRFSALVTLLLLCFFALMAGGTPSVWRAVFLHGAGLLAPLCKRENDPATSLLTALMALLLINPYSVASVSLQLSFTAVAGIYLLTPVLLKRWKPKETSASRTKRLARRVSHVFISTVAVSLGAIAFTTPLVAHYFGTVSLIGPVSNLLALWAVSDSFLLAVAAVVVGSVFPQAGFALAGVGDLLLRYLMNITLLLGELPFASFTLTSVYYIVGLAGLYGICCLHLFRPFGKQRLRVPLICSLVLISSCVWFTRSEFRSGDMTVAVLDVGQGQSVVLNCAGRTIVVDCGGSGYTDAGHVVADYLADVGVTKIDLLVLTHYHADHANGVPSLLRRMEVESATLPDVEPDDSLRRSVLSQLENAGTEISFVTENLRYQLDEHSALTLFSPLGTGSTNEQGLSVLMSAGSYDVLITGDMNTEVENRLVKYNDLPDIELLVAGHHGSRYSTGNTLLDQLHPETAVISVGAGNSYGHPAGETLERLAKRNITIYRTDLAGSVVLHTSGKE